MKPTLTLWDQPRPDAGAPPPLQPLPVDCKPCVIAQTNPDSHEYGADCYRCDVRAVAKQDAWLQMQAFLAKPPGSERAQFACDVSSETKRLDTLRRRLMGSAAPETYRDARRGDELA